MEGVSAELQRIWMGDFRARFGAEDHDYFAYVEPEPKSDEHHWGGIKLHAVRVEIGHLKTRELESLREALKLLAVNRAYPRSEKRQYLARPLRCRSLHGQRNTTQLHRASEKRLPKHVSAELEAFLKCRVLAHGFLRLNCNDCKREKLVAFSCKKRGFCSSCGGRRMAESAAHLIDEVFPEAREALPIHRAPGGGRGQALASA